MEILSATEDGVRYLGFVGAFDTTDVEQFQAHLDEAIDEQTFKVVINMARMTFVNSTALGALIRAQKRLKQYGGDLCIAEPSAFAAKVFKTLGIDRRIRTFGAEAQAVEYLDTVGLEGVGVEGESQVAFTFTAEEQVVAAGSEPRVGRLRTISEQGLAFQWEDLEGLDVARMFATGAPVRLRFALPLYHESHMFDAAGSIASSAPTSADRHLVQVRFTQLSDVERKAVQQYVNDMRYLKGELG